VRLLVFGSRTFDDEFIVGTVLHGFLSECEDRGEVLIIIDGEAPGADSLAGAFYGGAEDGIHGIHEDVAHERYAADWNSYGNAAGPYRNQREIDRGKPDIAVGFVDGVDTRGRPNTRGSADMHDRLLAAGVSTYLVLRGGFTTQKRVGT
jgi:hypothetical protein